MSFFEAQFTSRFEDKYDWSDAVQIYKAPDLQDALKQHERCSQIMCANYPDYDCKLVTMHEVTNPRKIKEYEKEWNK